MTHTKQCTRCHQIKGMAEFYLHKKGICKECIIKYSNEWREENPLRYKEWRKDYYARNKQGILQYSRKHRIKKREWLDQYRKDHSCTVCGEGDYRCLEFHHISGRSGRELSIPAMINYSIERIRQEIQDKCQLLCANCHQIIHYEELKSGKK